jgi:hypothetical protein
MKIKYILFISLPFQIQVIYKVLIIFVKIIIDFHNKDFKNLVNLKMTQNNKKIIFKIFNLSI